MAGTIQIGSPLHNQHLSGLKKDEKLAKLDPKDPALATVKSKEYESGFKLGIERQQLEQSASESKKAGYAAGSSTGKGATATSPKSAFSEPIQAEPFKNESVIVDETKVKTTETKTEIK